MTNHAFNAAWATWQQAAQNCQERADDSFRAKVALAKAIYERHEAWLVLCKLNPLEFKPTMVAEMNNCPHQISLSRPSQIKYRQVWAWLFDLGYDLDYMQGLPRFTFEMLSQMHTANLSRPEFDEACIQAVSLETVEDWYLWLSEVRNQKAHEHNARPDVAKYQPYQFFVEGHQSRSKTVWDLADEQGIELDPSWEDERKLTPKRLRIPPDHAPEPAHA